MSRVEITLIVVGLLLILGALLLQFSRRGSEPGQLAEVGLDELIGTLGEGLRKSEEAVRERGEAGRFLFSKAEVEIAFTLKQVRSASGELSVEPVAVKAGEENAREVHHRLKVYLKARPDRSGTSAPSPRNN